MKLLSIASFALIVLGPGVVSAQTASMPFVSETTAELSAGLDANGDGLTDCLVVDKATGVRRLGIQQSDGTFSWGDPVATGLDNITGLGIGRFADSTAAEGFAVAAPLWNRVLVFPDATGDPTVAPTAGIGPNLAVGFNFAGDIRDDLAIGTEWDKGTAPVHLSGFTSGDAGLSPIYGPHEETGMLSQGNRARFEESRLWMLGALREAGGGKEFITRPIFGFPGFADGPTLGGLAEDTEWVWGEFKTNDLARFLFYSPGATTLFVPGLQEPNPYEYGWTAGSTYDLGQAIARVMVLPPPGAARLLVLFDDGASAGIYDFDGTQPPVLRQTMTPAAGTRFSLGAALGNGDFVMLGGATGGSGSSTTWQHWGFDGKQYQVVASGSLPAVKASQNRANVLLFGTDFNLDPDAPLLATLRVGDWSDSAASAVGKLHVTSEQYLGTSSGLGSAGASDVSVSLAGYFSTVNQKNPTESLAVLEPPATTAFVDLRFSPAPGTYPPDPVAGLQVSILSTTGDPVQYRANSTGPWVLFDPANPPTITATTTLQAFVDALSPGPIRSATYNIAAAPGLVVPPPVDANHNGLPDAWEQAFGVSDPQGDPDGDGFTNLQEYLAGTDPLDPSSVPSADVSQISLLVRPPGTNAPPGTLCEIAWPASFTNVVLEATSDPGDASSWADAGGTAVKVGNEWVHYENVSTAVKARFYRLRKQP
jgi:hypothetical protein